MPRASTLTSLSAVILLLAGASIAALTADAPEELSIARLSPDIVATQAAPIEIDVDLPVSLLGRDAPSQALLGAVSIPPASGVRVLRAEPLRHRIRLSLDVSQARAGKWTVTLGGRYRAQSR